MLIWGGQVSTAGDFVLVDDGGSYDPATDAWQPIASLGAPSRRQKPGVVWTGTEMIIWGGLCSSGSALDQHECNDGAAYDPATDHWRTISNVGAPSARTTRLAWTGQEVVAWGGYSAGKYLGDGALYNPATDSWRRMTGIGAPTPRSENFTFWLSDRLLIFGGDDSEFGGPSDGAFFRP